MLCMLCSGAPLACAWLCICIHTAQTASTARSVLSILLVLVAQSHVHFCISCILCMSCTLLYVMYTSVCHVYFSMSCILCVSCTVLYVMYTSVCIVMCSHVYDTQQYAGVPHHSLDTGILSADFHKLHDQAFGPQRWARSCFMRTAVCEREFSSTCENPALPEVPADDT